MRKQVILCLKVAWTVAALTTLFTTSAVCGFNQQACHVSGETMLLAMGFLTFPLGLICILVSVVVCGAMGSEYPSGDFTIWFIMALGGCLQWFVIAPQCLEEPTLTVLNLNSTPPPTVAPLIAANPQSLAEAPKSMTTPAIAVPLRIRQRNRPNRINAFDRFGRTPLERVISR